MIYDLSRELDRLRFQDRARKLTDRGALVELTEKVQRTLSQNAYLHLLIGIVAMDTGNSLDTIKREIFKKKVNPDIFLRTRTDRHLGDIEILLSSAEISKEDMSRAIDRFKQWGRDHDFLFPEPGDDALLREIEIEMARNRYI